MTTTMNVQVAHQVPGRIRLKVPNVKDNPELVDQIKQMFHVIPGIEDVTVNPTTGSVVLCYDTDKHDEFHGHLERHHTGGHDRPPTNEIDALANKIGQEAEFLAEHPTPPASSSITSSISMSRSNWRPETSSI
jgi:Heavy metal associated domain 2